MLRGFLGALLLPPNLFVLLALLGGLLAWRGRRWAGALAAIAALALLALATPMVSGLLLASLQRNLPAEAAGDAAPGAIIVLGAEVVRGTAGLDIGPLTLERLRAGAALHRRTGLPLLVTGGSIQPGDQPLAAMMAHSLAEDFRVAVRWVEPRAADTWENAALSATILRREGIAAAYVVTHGWHLPRALAAFARQGFGADPAPVRLDPVPSGHLGDAMPRADHLNESWWAVHEWAGQLYYALRGRGAVAAD